MLLLFNLDFEYWKLSLLTILIHMIPVNSITCTYLLNVLMLRIVLVFGGQLNKIGDHKDGYITMETKYLQLHSMFKTEYKP
jgi:hypothetical protein